MSGVELGWPRPVYVNGKAGVRRRKAQMTSEATTLGSVVSTGGSGPWLAGIIPPVCTPLTAEGEVDTLSLEHLVGFLLDVGVSGLFMLGSSGEAAFLTDAQRDTVLQVAVKTNGGQVPVLAGTIDMATNRVLDHAARARDLGADAIVVTAPFYVRTGHPSEVKLHFKTVRDRAGLPVIAYDIPVAVHHKLEVPVVAELAAEGVIDAVKDSSGDINSFRALAGRTRSLEKFSLLTGSELIVDCSVFVGGHGAVPGLANVDPHGFVALYQSCRAGDWDRAREYPGEAHAALRDHGVRRSRHQGPELVRAGWVQDCAHAARRNCFECHGPAPNSSGAG